MRLRRQGDDALLIEGTIEGGPEAVSGSLREIRRLLVTIRPFDTLDSTWEIVVAEVLNNIVEHAYHDCAAGEIQLSLHFAPVFMRADFVDFGQPMPDDTPPEGNAADLSVNTENLPEGGFGWHLIRTLSSNLEYRREAGRNCLSLEVPLTQNS